VHPFGRQAAGARAPTVVAGRAILLGRSPRPLVVGLHFVAFAFVWNEASIAVPGAIVFLLGAAGLALIATSADRWVPLVSGVPSGFVLLAGSLGAVRRSS
jgi:hypothetical protein